MNELDLVLVNKYSSRITNLTITLTVEGLNSPNLVEIVSVLDSKMIIPSKLKYPEVFRNFVSLQFDCNQEKITVSKKAILLAKGMVLGIIFDRDMNVHIGMVKEKNSNVETNEDKNEETNEEIIKELDMIYQTNRICI
jgi:hypothetical protein